MQYKLVLFKQLRRSAIRKVTVGLVEITGSGRQVCVCVHD